MAESLQTRDVLWALGSCCALAGKPFDGQLVLQQHAPPYSAATLVRAARALGFAAEQQRVRSCDLTPAEAGQVFESLRGRIVGGDKFDTAPAGADGMGVLVRAQPTLQGRLIDFLESLPKERTGPWACRGWEGGLKDPEAKERFQKLLGAWSGVENNEFLKTAAQAVLRTPRKQA